MHLQVSIAVRLRSNDSARIVKRQKDGRYKVRWEGEDWEAHREADMSSGLREVSHLAE